MRDLGDVAMDVDTVQELLIWAKMPLSRNPRTREVDTISLACEWPAQGGSRESEGGRRSGRASQGGCRGASADGNFQVSGAVEEGKGLSL